MTSQIHRLQEHAHSAAKNLAAPWKAGTPTTCPTLPEDDGVRELADDEEWPHKQYRPLLHAPPKGYGALSRTDNPWRERFLVPLYACNEQETGSQMHMRQLLHLAKATNRTLVLPNWGFGVGQLALQVLGPLLTAFPLESDSNHQQLPPVRL